jgi:CheY-like chemotaxis protein
VVHGIEVLYGRSMEIEEKNTLADVLVLIDDLFFQAKISETARQVGTALQMVSSGEALLAAAAANPPRLIVVDLNARNAPLEALERLQAAGNPVPVIAFLSHVQVELAERARAAGCRQVLPRSKFTVEMASILAQAKT